LVKNYPTSNKEIIIPKVNIIVHAEKVINLANLPLKNKPTSGVGGNNGSTVPPPAPAVLPPLPPSVSLDFSLYEQYGMQETIFSCLKDLYYMIDAGIQHKTEEGSLVNVIAPMRFVEVLREKNELYRGAMHQDAHEFLNFLLNAIIEDMNLHGNATGKGQIHDLFEGRMVSETKCLTCENITTREEEFLDLSIDIEAHTSVTACLGQFSSSEMLCEKNKFHCDICCGLQEAEKRMKIKKAPQILALHLKRFKYAESMQRLYKLLHRVVYPPELRLFHMVDDSEESERLYELYAIVVHIGGGAYHGHYVTIVKDDNTDEIEAKKGSWLLFDDDNVERVDDGFVYRFFGDGRGLANAYVLFYRTKEETPSDAPSKSSSEIVVPETIPNPIERAKTLHLPDSPEQEKVLIHSLTNPVEANVSKEESDKKREDRFSVGGLKFGQRRSTSSTIPAGDKDKKVKRVASTGSSMKSLFGGKKRENTGFNSQVD
jgi:ubiquitin C-terminal hydrolase